MAGKEEHQPTPWTWDGRKILNAKRWPLATASYPADARRIVAAVNATAGIPTPMLESGVVRDLLERYADAVLKGNPDLDRFFESPSH